MAPNSSVAATYPSGSRAHTCTQVPPRTCKHLCMHVSHTHTHTLYKKTHAAGWTDGCSTPVPEPPLTSPPQGSPSVSPDWLASPLLEEQSLPRVARGRQEEGTRKARGRHSPLLGVWSSAESAYSRKRLSADAAAKSLIFPDFLRQTAQTAVGKKPKQIMKSFLFRLSLPTQCQQGCSGQPVTASQGLYDILLRTKI